MTRWRSETLGHALKRASMSSRRWIIGYLVASTLLFSLVWFLTYDAAIYFYPAMLLDAAMIYMLHRLMLADNGLLSGKTGGFLGYLLLGLLVGVATLIGLVFFIIPGIYVYLRWLPAFSHQIARGEGLGSAMDWSWKASHDMAWPLAKHMAVPLFVIVFWSWYSFFPGDFERFYGPSFDLLTILLGSISTAWITAVCVAAYCVCEEVQKETA